MDEAPTKWNVTFTKHLKQKRKLYRDGFLSLHSSAKVMLYDGSDQLLECRILKNDEVVRSGETLTFNAYLVDVGEPEGGQKPLDDTYAYSRENKVPKRTNLLHRNKFVNVSDCAGIVCSYVFAFLNAGVSVVLKIDDSCLYVCKFVPIIYQVFLYDTSWKLLDSRFLNKAEEVSPGEMMEFPGHLVEVGNREANHESLRELNLTGDFAIGNSQASHGQADPKCCSNNLVSEASLSHGSHSDASDKRMDPEGDRDPLKVKAECPSFDLGF